MKHPVTMTRLVVFVDEEDEKDVTLAQLKFVQNTLNAHPVEKDDVLQLKVCTLKRVKGKDRKALQMIVFDPEINISRMRVLVEQDGSLVP